MLLALCAFKLIYLYTFRVIVFWLLITLFVESHPPCLVLKLRMKFYLAFLLPLMNYVVLGAYVMLTNTVQKGTIFQVGVEDVFLLGTLKVKRVRKYMMLKWEIILFLEMYAFIKLNFLLPILLLPLYLHKLLPQTLKTLFIMTLLFLLPLCIYYVSMHRALYSYSLTGSVCNEGVASPTVGSGVSESEPFGERLNDMDEATMEFATSHEPTHSLRHSDIHFDALETTTTSSPILREEAVATPTVLDSDDKGNDKRIRYLSTKFRGFVTNTIQKVSPSASSSPISSKTSF